MSKKIWHVLAIFAFSVVALAGCSSGGGGSTFDPSNNKVTVQGTVPTAVAKTAEATAPAGTIYAIDAMTATVLGQGAVNGTDGTFNVSFTLPGTTAAIVLKADLGSKGIYREIFTFDATRQSSTLPTAPQFVLNAASTARVAAISTALGLTGILGETGVTTTAAFSTVQTQVALNGGTNLAPTSSGFSLVGMLDPSLFPKPAAVTVTRTDTNPTAPGATLSLSATVTDPLLQGKAVTYSWALSRGTYGGKSVTYGPDGVTLAGTTTATPTITLPNSLAFKTKAIEKYNLINFTASPDEPLIDIDRYQVVPFNTDSAVTFANAVKVTLTATIDGKQYPVTYTANVVTPVVPNTGLSNVPIGQPVVLQGKFPFTSAPKTSWNWSVTDPNGTAVTVNDATSKYPDFIPTVAGAYTVKESGTQVMTITAGLWQGMMAGVNTPDSSCKACHSSTVTSWLATGHLQPLYSGIKETVASGGHYNATSCAVCHTVGYAQYKASVNANGFSDVVATEGGLKFTQGDTDPATTLWGTNPKSSKLIGIQCENCHGPQNSSAHMVTDPTMGTIANPNAPVGNSRVSYASEVCASCHGRATNHARYQQWVLGAAAKTGPNNGFSHGNHATYTFNSDETTGLLGNCQACHSAQGFAAWRKTLPSSPAYSATAVPGLTVSNAQPITCVACHDPHNEGDADVVTSDNLTTVGATPGSTYLLPGGFQANGVGMGALCITCHNSRTGVTTASPTGAGLHEDGTPIAAYATPTSYSAPHEACQGDVLMGRNAYWLGADKYNSSSTRSKHSYITDTCVTCHMDLTDTSPYGAAGQKRHDFVATLDICNKCHTAYSGDAVQTAFDAQLNIVKQAVGQAILRLKFNDSIPAGTTAVLVANRQGQIDVTSNGVTRRWFISTRNNNDAFLTDPNNSGALVQGCTGTATLASCTGYLAGVTTPTAATLAISGSNVTINATGINPVIAKALWNTVLVQDDASRGIHNPSFTANVMAQSVSHVMNFTP